MPAALILEIAAVLVAAALGYWLWYRRRHRGSARDAPNLQSRDEVFVDPSTGRRDRRAGLPGRG